MSRLSAVSDLRIDGRNQTVLGLFSNDVSAWDGISSRTVRK